MAKNNVKKEEIVIEHLKFPECIRRRVGMYLGSVANSNVALREIIDNSTDELAAGYGDTVLISNDFNGYKYVSDNGRGIPITISNTDPDKTNAYLSISDLHTGSKFKSTNDARTGMNGVGSSAICAVSSTYILMSKITEDNYNRSIPEVQQLWENSGPRSKKDLFYIVVCEKGIKVFENAGKLKDIDNYIFKDMENHIPIPEDQSTIIMFKPDDEIFESTEAAIPEINLQYFLLIQDKFFNRKLNILVNGQKLNSTFNPYKFEVLKTIIPKDTSKNKQVSMYITFEYDPTLGSKSIIGSVNGLEVNSGQHIQIAESCIKTALREEFKIKHEYLLNGLQMCVIVLASDCIFSEQIKSNLRSISKVKVTDFTDMVKELVKTFRKNTTYWEDIVGKLNYLAESMRNVGAVEKAQKIIESSTGNSWYRSKNDLVPGFSDATSGPSDRWNCELFLCEGLSPAGSLKSGRKTTKYHAVLPLRGKVKNVSEVDANTMMENKEFFTIFKLIGLGIDDNNVTKGCKTYEEAMNKIAKHSRYGKIIIATDEDSDGSQIRSGLLYAFLKFARFMIDAGIVYYSEGPLFKQNGKFYYQSDIQPGSLFPGGDFDPSKHFSRFKGLGSIDKDDIYDAYFNPLTRRIVQVTPENVEYAMSLVEDIDQRKTLLYNAGILSNPYNFNDL